MSKELPPEQAAKLAWLVKSGILPTVENQIRRLSAAYHWFDYSQPPGQQLVDSASICFVHTGERLLGISNWHVHNAAVANLECGDLHTCQIGGATFDPRERLIDMSQHYDLVTYDISEIQVNQANADIHYAPEWPPRLDESALVIVGGWVDALKAEQPGRTTHKFLHIISRTDNLADEQIGVVTYTSSSHPWGLEGPLAGTQLGGMSGGPVFLVRENPLTKIYLVGIVYEYSPTYEIALARPLGLVESNGRIKTK